MKSGIVITLLLFASSTYAQRNILYFKKGRKPVSSYFEGSSITFLSKDREWEKGIIKKMTTDSIYIKPYEAPPIGTDTFFLNTTGFSIADIYAMPKSGLLISYKNGRFQINRAGGHVHFYWIKAGALFRIGAATYLGVALINSLTSKTNKLTVSDVAWSAGVFGFGMVLKLLYKPYHKIGKKYHFKVLSY